MKDSNLNYSGTAQSQLKNDLFRELYIVWLATNLIDAAPRRVRRALEKQVLGVVDAIKAFGFRIPILVRKTASGERYDMNKLTAAHRELPFGTRVRVTNLDNGRQVEVRITDRGPFIRGRIIDLSREAARRIGMIQAGTARVRIEVTS